MSCSFGRFGLMSSNVNKGLLHGILAIVTCQQRFASPVLDMASRHEKGQGCQQQHCCTSATSCHAWECLPCKMTHHPPPHMYPTA